jgi:hypothetical protein
VKYLFSPGKLDRKTGTNACEELHNEHPLRSIVRVIKLRRISWRTHRENYKCVQNFDRKRERPCERPRGVDWKISLWILEKYVSSFLDRLLDQVVTLLNCIQEMAGSNFERGTNFLAQVFVFILSIFRQISG